MKGVSEQHAANSIGCIVLHAVLATVCWASASAAQPCAPGMRIFQHAAGVDCIPVSPERIVALHDGNVLLPLLELGVTPVGASGETGPEGRPFFRNTEAYDTSDITVVGKHRNESAEVVTYLEPDLIITTPSPEWHYATYSEIAPTIVIDVFKQPLRAALHQFADAVDRTERAQKLEARFDASIAEAQAQLGDVPAQTTALAMTYFGQRMRTMPWVHGYRAAFEAIGFRKPDWQKEFAGGSRVVEFSHEALLNMTVDAIFLIDFSGVSGPDGDYEKFMSNPLVKVTNVASANQIFELDGSKMGGVSWLRTIDAIDQIQEILSHTTFDPNVHVEAQP
ncbi:MAG: ABC transporter substrate-binding protein [Pseudomonadota bacterium]